MLILSLGVAIHHRHHAWVGSYFGNGKVYKLFVNRMVCVKKRGPLSRIEQRSILHLSLPPCPIPASILPGSQNDLEWPSPGLLHPALSSIKRDWVHILGSTSEPPFSCLGCCIHGNHGLASLGGCEVRPMPLCWPGRAVPPILEPPHYFRGSSLCLLWQPFGLEGSIALALELVFHDARWSPAFLAFHLKCRSVQSSLGPLVIPCRWRFHGVLQVCVGV